MKRRGGVRRALRWAARVLLGVVAVAGLWALFWTYYNPSVEPAPPLVVARKPRGDRITVVLGGDFAPTDAAMETIRREGYDYPYRKTAHLLREADIAFANLEAPVTASDDRFPLWRKYLYKVEPAAIPAWRDVGFDLVSLANNHISDYRDRGVVDTVRHLRAAGIATVGAGPTERQARRPVIFRVGSTRIGFVAYLERKLPFNLYLRMYAVGGRTGAAMLNAADLEHDIRRLRPKVDVLIVSVHWGKNYRPVTDDQRAYARRLAELGVDLVVGHHPHDIQPVEKRGKTVILYSLGNYAWGTPGYDHFRLGLLARLTITPRRGKRPGAISALELLPIVTQNRIVHFQPRLMTYPERRWLDGFIEASRKRFSTPVELDGTIVRVPL